MNSETKLDFGRNADIWRKETRDMLATKCGADAMAQAFERRFSSEHTQHSGRRYEYIHTSAVYVPCPLESLRGKTVECIKYITARQYHKLKSIEDQEEYSMVSDSNKKDIIDNHPKDCDYYKISLREIPISSDDYTPRYRFDLYDPRLNGRYSVRPSMVAELLKAEKECVKDLFTICAELRNYIGARLLSCLESEAKYLQAKSEGRADWMILLATEAATRGSTVPVVGQGNNNGRRAMYSLMHMRINDTTLLKHKQNFAAAYDLLTLSGFNVENRSSMEDPTSPFEYMLGQMYLYSVSERFKAEIDQAGAVKDKLNSPNLHYLSAIQMVDDWNRDRESSLSGTMSRQKPKVEQPTGEVKIALASSRVYPHNTAVDNGPSEESPAKGKSAKRDIPTRQERMAVYTCEHCGVIGHFGTDCTHPATTDAMRAENQAFKDARLNGRKGGSKKKRFKAS